MTDSGMLRQDAFASIARGFSPLMQMSQVADA